MRWELNLGFFVIKKNIEMETSISHLELLSELLRVSEDESILLVFNQLM